MRLKPIHSRDDLIDAIRGKCVYTSCNRAIDTGTVTVLGGFTPSEGISEVHHWVLRIESKYHNVWIVSVSGTSTGSKVRIIDYIPWAHWDGDAAGSPSIYNGDDPAHSHHMHLVAKGQQDATRKAY